MGRRKRVSFSVDEDEYNALMDDYFRREAKIRNIPLGKLLGRAFYLACLEANGDRGLKRDLDVVRRTAKSNGEIFDDEICLSTEDWKKVYGFYRE